MKALAPGTVLSPEAIAVSKADQNKTKQKNSLQGLTLQGEADSPQDT
jgi:hypothetical protein